jgi:hypothetical protein
MTWTRQQQKDINEAIIEQCQAIKILLEKKRSFDNTEAIKILLGHIEDGAAN